MPTFALAPNEPGLRAVSAKTLLLDRSRFERRLGSGVQYPREAFSAKLRDETDLYALSDELVGKVRDNIQLVPVSLWLRPDTAMKGEQAD